MVIGFAVIAASCDTLLGDDDEEEHIDAFGYELVQDGEVILRLDPSEEHDDHDDENGHDHGVILDEDEDESPFTHNPHGHHDDFYPEHHDQFMLSAAVVHEDGYTDPITVHFLDDEGHRIELEDYEGDGGEGEHQLGWHGSADDELELPHLENHHVKVKKYHDYTWQFRFYTDEELDDPYQHEDDGHSRGSIANGDDDDHEYPHGDLQLELWHIDHADFVAPDLKVYVMKGEGHNDDHD